jgi:hypothetical protein
VLDGIQQFDHGLGFFHGSFFGFDFFGFGVGDTVHVSSGQFTDFVRHLSSFLSFSSFFERRKKKYFTSFVTYKFIRLI